MYQDIFRGIDGSNISQINRSALGSGQDQHALTYGEVELPECIRILHEAGARDNQIFVDLVRGEIGPFAVCSFLTDYETTDNLLDLL